MAFQCKEKLRVMNSKSCFVVIGAVHIGQISIIICNGVRFPKSYPVIPSTSMYVCMYITSIGTYYQGILLGILPTYDGEYDQPLEGGPPDEPHGRSTDRIGATQEEEGAEKSKLYGR